MSKSVCTLPFEYVDTPERRVHNLEADGIPLVFECGGKACRLFPGNALVTQPDEWHRLSTNPKGLVMAWLIFRLKPENRTVLYLPAAESDSLKQLLSALPRRLFKGNDRLRFAFLRLSKMRDGLAPGPFRSLPIRGAQQRLRDTAEPVTAIARSLGFSSSQHFAMQFKREFGLTPSAWRSGHTPALRPAEPETS